MWSSRYWSVRYWTSRYWPPAGAAAVDPLTPYCIEAQGNFVAGSEAGQVYIGVSAGSYTPGTTAGQVFATGSEFGSSYMPGSEAGQVC